MSDLAVGARLLGALRTLPGHDGRRWWKARDSAERGAPVSLRILHGYDDAGEEFRSMQRAPDLDFWARLSVTVEVMGDLDCNSRLACFFGDPSVRSVLAHLRAFKVDFLGTLVREHVGFLVSSRLASIKFSSVVALHTTYEGLHELAASTTLRSLWFEETDFNAFATPLLRLLDASRSITQLRLHSVELTGSDESATFLRGLARMTRIEDLEIYGNELGDSIFELTALAASPRLRTLDLTYNRFAASSMLALAEFAQHCTALQSLELRGNDRIAASAFVQLSGFIESPCLAWLDLSDVQLFDSGIRALWPLSGCQSLRTLLLGYNEITDGGVEDLLVFATSPSLRLLDLSSNRLTLRGARELLQVVQLGFVAVNLISNGLTRDQVARLRRAYGENFVCAPTVERPMWT